MHERDGSAKTRRANRRASSRESAADHHEIVRLTVPCGFGLRRKFQRFATQLRKLRKVVRRLVRRIDRHKKERVDASVKASEIAQRDVDRELIANLDDVSLLPRPFERFRSEFRLERSSVNDDLKTTGRVVGRPRGDPVSGAGVDAVTSLRGEGDLDGSVRDGITPSVRDQVRGTDEPDGLRVDSPSALLREAFRFDVEGVWNRFESLGARADARKRETRGK